MYELGLNGHKKSFINYLIYFNRETKTWEYNSNISEGLRKRIFDTNPELAKSFVEHLKEQEKLHPMSINALEFISFSDLGEDF